MSVTAPPRPPSPARAHTREALREEALIKEARQRARRRRQRYAALLVMATVIVGVGAQPSAAARPLAPAAPSTMRSTIVFVSSQRNSTAGLYRINADGSGLHRLPRASVARLAWQRTFWPAISPDGRRVAFQAGPLNQPAIELANLDGTGVHLVNRGVRPSWSPDGTHIAYSTLSRGIYVERADGTDGRLVTLRGTRVMARRARQALLGRLVGRLVLNACRPVDLV